MKRLGVEKTKARPKVALATQRIHISPDKTLTLLKHFLKGKSRYAWGKCKVMYVFEMYWFNAQSYLQ